MTLFLLYVFALDQENTQCSALLVVLQIVGCSAVVGAVVNGWWFSFKQTCKHQQ